MSTKIYQSADVVTDPSPRLSSATASLAAVLEYIDTLYSDLGWTIKFRKCKVSRERMGMESAKALQKKARPRVAAARRIVEPCVVGADFMGHMAESPGLEMERRGS